ncbi:hypothetical protein B0A48_17113 [Cryoendolithus antarcticus]|uniref:Carboxylic ester hydrolase n=1 Tax=Cryoendolithus antarcticus TaxID=1507870 RepID=A0A1V8SBU2_9PEZI|nr:hypothetical protein B0A48_17113 [Cryoendolithus antarcticus]
MARFTALISLLAAASTFLTGSNAAAIEKRASLTQVTGFSSSNPSNTKMYIYVPAKLSAKPAVIVAIHFCTGTAQAYYSQTPYAGYADKYGLIVIFPESPYSGTCWDVSSTNALKHDGSGSDSKAIADMVTYTLSKYSGDASKVFVTGSSSGAMMTNVMAATYPELFAAATAYSGVPAGCFASSSGAVDAWNSQCAQGQSIKTAAQWTTIVQNMYQGYSGARPRFQVKHGSIDSTLLPQNYNETVKEWTGVFGYNAATPAKRQFNFPKSGYTTDSWGIDSANPLGKVQGVYAVNVGHTVPVDGDQDLQWFQLGPYATTGSATTTKAASSTVAATSTTRVATSAPATTTKAATTTSAAATTSAASGGTGASQWSQCGGISWTGATSCASPYKCVVVNPYYSQCQ